MKILVITPHYPPLHAGTFDFRAWALVNALTARGRQVRVLTSNHGLLGEQHDDEIERRLWLAGKFEHERPVGLRALRAHESHNHRVLAEALTNFQPNAVLVWSLAGLSKSLAFTLYRARIPVVFGVSDDWLVPGLQEDDWLRWWNAPGTNLQRMLLEWTGRRHAQDGVAPTRLMRGYDRMPEVYGPPREADAPAQVVHGFRFDRVFFASRHLRDEAIQAGFQVADAPVIPCAISSSTFQGPVQPASRPMRKVLAVGPFDARSGLDTLLEAITAVRDEGVLLELTAYGRGDPQYIAALSSFAAQRKLVIQFVTPADQEREFASVLRRHDLFVAPGEDPQGSAVAPSQAMACGLPVVGTRLGAAGELLLHEETALTFKPGVVADLTQQLRRLIAEPELRERIAQAGQERVVMEANDSLVLDRIETLVEEAAERRRLR